MSPQPQLPILARDLITRVQEAAEHWSRRIRNSVDAVEIGQFRHVDHANAHFLELVLAEHGWPGHRLVGVDGCRAAWRIALHADRFDLQRAAAHLLHRAVAEDDAPAWQWAHLQDRTLIMGAQAQEWGTQYRITPTGVHRCPVREPAGLDTRRATLGLPPAAIAMAALLDRLAVSRQAAVPTDGVDALLLLAGAA
ncbi:hypothetical protein GTY81_19535 [Streptomyces sp. SID8366]|uniref:DUF6624 domain-containing protein n=1 Tax=unclassified Streptomyces TaxID=2593676 RepID=UPI000DBA0499|nr:DUF6624 domain-containing protein [Streptomyces sp. PsTaAH-130]MYU06035.1 hypothetical protein [Streptomyces sp. SID8366]MYU67466.1 hypothetical protein [Streptomyces sp. SID69]RAJ64099.1 hypothetical protein K376_01195 [Streptomyces sp. PsTaAH-130]